LIFSSHCLHSLEMNWLHLHYYWAKTHWEQKSYEINLFFHDRALEQIYCKGSLHDVCNYFNIFTILNTVIYSKTSFSTLILTFCHKHLVWVLYISYKTGHCYDWLKSFCREKYQCLQYCTFVFWKHYLLYKTFIYKKSIMNLCLHLFCFEVVYLRLLIAVFRSNSVGIALSFSKSFFANSALNCAWSQTQVCSEMMRTNIIFHHDPRHCFYNKPSIHS